MLDELDNFEIRISEESHNRFGAFKTGVHNDLVVALGIAVYGGEQFGTETIMMRDNRRRGLKKNGRIRSH